MERLELDRVHLNKALKASVFALFTLLTPFSVTSQEGFFESKQITSGVVWNETQLSYYRDEQEVGFLSYTKLPCLNRYVVHSFYVYPNCRNKGNGTALLAYACTYLTKKQAKTVYVQPGPFELDSAGKPIVVDEYQSRLQQLVAFYTKNGFTVTTNALTAYVLQAAYRCMGLQEDARYLMVRQLDTQ